ncbi:MAG TPA: ABC transporter permease, partial [Terriglobia bacterium]|nr:ABC transporter permease [Terriglobia bacterium]
STVCANAINYLVALPLLLVFIFAFGVKPTPSLLLFPFALLLLTLMATGVGALLSAIMPFFLDLQHLIEVVFTMWFFLSPVVYPISLVNDHPRWRGLYQMNPMVGIIQLVHSVFLGHPVESASLAIAIVESVGIFACGIWVFNRLSVHCTEV